MVLLYAFEWTICKARYLEGKLKMKRYLLGQILLLFAILMIIILGALNWLKLIDVKVTGGLFVTALILIGAGIYMSKKK